MSNAKRVSNFGKRCMYVCSTVCHSYALFIISTRKSLTKLNKSTAHARKTIDKAKKLQKKGKKTEKQLLNITAKQFVTTACQREDPAAWLDKIQAEVKRMRRTLGLATAPINKPRPITTTTKSLPPWFDTMHKSKEIKCKSRYVHYK